MSVPPRLTHSFSPASYETADCADGRKIVEWLKETERLPEGIEAVRGPTVARRLNAWKRGANPDYFTVDRILFEFDVHPRELPDSVWLRRQRKAA